MSIFDDGQSPRRFPRDTNLSARYQNADEIDVAERMAKTGKSWGDLMVTLHDDPLERLQDAYANGTAPFVRPAGPFSAIRKAMRLALYEQITRPGLRTFIVLTNAHQASHFTDFFGIAEEIKRYRVLEKTTFIIPDCVLREFGKADPLSVSCLMTTMKKSLANFSIGITDFPLLAVPLQDVDRGIAIKDIYRDYCHNFGRENVFIVLDDAVTPEILLSLSHEALAAAVRKPAPAGLSRSDNRWLTTSDMSAVLSPLFNDELVAYTDRADLEEDIAFMAATPPATAAEQQTMARVYASMAADNEAMNALPRAFSVDPCWVENQCTMFPGVRSALDVAHGRSKAVTG